MADQPAEDRGPTVYGLWNEALGEWFNPGTRRPYFATRGEAMRFIPLALRQYSVGKWQVQEYPLDVSGLDDPSQVAPEPARPGAA